MLFSQLWKWVVSNCQFRKSINLESISAGLFYCVTSLIHLNWKISNVWVFIYFSPRSICFENTNCSASVSIWNYWKLFPCFQLKAEYHWWTGEWRYLLKIQTAKVNLNRYIVSVFIAFYLLPGEVLSSWMIPT